MGSPGAGSAVCATALQVLGVGNRLPYLVAVVLMGIGLYVAIADPNLVKKVVGLNVFQTGIFLFLVVAAYRDGGRAPLLEHPGPYVNPVPHVLVLTAIVVGVSLTAVALSLVVRIHREYGSLREDVVLDAVAAEQRGSGGASGDE